MLAVSEMLLERDGVLMGVNLAEVAESVGVNRSLIYQYFGSRKGLLRRALTRKVERALAQFYPPGLTRHPFMSPDRSPYAVAILDPVYLKLMALLHLDGDESLLLMPRLDEAVKLLKLERDAGRLPADIDLKALHVTLFSLYVGYGLFRERMADEVGLSLKVLDARMERVHQQIVAGLQTASTPDPA